MPASDHGGIDGSGLERMLRPAAPGFHMALPTLRALHRVEARRGPALIRCRATCICATARGTGDRSDAEVQQPCAGCSGRLRAPGGSGASRTRSPRPGTPSASAAPRRGCSTPARLQWPPPARSPSRSEEHTSELQSLMRISYAVFCLKKKRSILTVQQKYIHILHTTRNKETMIQRRQYIDT